MGTALLVLGGCLLLGRDVAAVRTQGGGQPPKPLVFGSGVTIVAVPVFVTDKSGRSVGGLTADDFEVEDNGKKTPIVAFQAIDVDAPPPPETIASLPVGAQAAARRQFLILVDMEFSTLRGLAQSRRAAAAYVRETLAPGDLVAAATSGKTGINLLTNFTADHEYVARALEGGKVQNDRVTDPLGLGTGSPPSGRRAEADEATAEIEAQERDFLEDVRSHDAHAFLTNAVSLVKLLAPLRGRKQLVLMSASFPESVWMPATASYPGSNPATRQTNPDENNRTMKELFREAAAADVVIHAIDLNGLEGPMDLSQQIAATGAADVRSTGGARSGQGTLVALAHNTGGTYVRPRNDFERALADMDQVSRRSYVLAFEAAADKPDQPRKLKVRVRRDGLTVSHRTTYTLAASNAVTATEGAKLQAAEAISKGLTEGPLQLDVVALPYQDAEGRPVVHAVLQVGGPALTEAAQGATLPLQVYGYALDNGRVLDSIAMNGSIDLAKAGADVQRSGLGIVTAFPVSAPSVDLRFFVRAGSAGAIGSLEKSVPAPDTIEAGWISPPMFTLPRAGHFAIPFQPSGRPRIDVPFRLGEEAFIPDPAPVLTRARPREVCVFVRSRSAASEPLEVSGEFRQGGGAAKPLRAEGLRIVKDRDGFDRYVLTVRAPELVPGAYVLRLKFTDPETARSRTTEVAVRLDP